MAMEIINGSDRVECPRMSSHLRRHGSLRSSFVRAIPPSCWWSCMLVCLPDICVFMDLSGLWYASLRPLSGVVGEPGAAAAVGCSLMALSAALVVGQEALGWY